MSHDDATTPLDRRKVLGALGAVGVAGLAGCTAEEDEDNETSGGGGGAPSRPQLEFDPDDLDNRVLAFLAESAEYQNRMIEENL